MKAIYMPENFRQGDTTGTRNNKGIEGLSIIPGNDTEFFTAIEHPLLQDQKVYKIEDSASLRISKIKAHRTKNPEFLYIMKPAIAPKAITGEVKFSHKALVSLQAIDEYRFLSTEVTFFLYPGIAHDRIEIFLNDIRGAEDVSSTSSLRSSKELPSAVKKTLLFDSEKVHHKFPKDIRMFENFEGMTFGPDIDEDHHSLILVSDNNFSDKQRTIFLVLKLEKTALK